MLFYLLFGTQRPVSYTVHEAPEPASDRIDRAEALRFVKDGFQLPAALFAPAWLFVHRLWLGLAAYLAAAGGILLLDALIDLPEAALLVLFAALHLVVGFEADAIERVTLEGRGWVSIGTITGTSALECERRFFEAWLPQQPILTPRRPIETAPAGAAAMASIAATPAAPRPTGAGRLAALLKGRR
jgi:hypothetical protein